jgi:Ca2+-binding RTX toxin-like protein
MKVMRWSGLLVALSVGLLVATLVAMLNVAHASHVPDCFGSHPTNTPTPGNDIIVGTAGDDVLAGGVGNDEINGANGNDKLCGGSGVDALFGGEGNDQAEGGDDNDDIFGENGNDKLYASTVFTGPIPTFPQTCHQSGELSLVVGPAEGGGNQYTERGPGNTIAGNDGYDLVVGATREDFLSGGPRGDDLYGLGGKDRLDGDSGADCLSGGPDTDYLFDWDLGNVEPDDFDTLWGGDFAWDSLNAKDGDGEDTLDGGRIEFGDDNCYQDRFDVTEDCD